MGRRFSEVIDIARRRLGDGGRATVLYTTYIWSSPALMARARPKHSNVLQRRSDKRPAHHPTRSDHDQASMRRDIAIMRVEMQTHTRCMRDGQPMRHARGPPAPEGNEGGRGAQNAQARRPPRVFASPKGGFLPSPVRDGGPTAADGSIPTGRARLRRSVPTLDPVLTARVALQRDRATEVGFGQR